MKEVRTAGELGGGEGECRTAFGAAWWLPPQTTHMLSGQHLSYRASHHYITCPAL